MKKEIKEVNINNLNLIRNLAMYAEDDLQFYKQITDFLYHLANNMEYKKARIAQDKLYNFMESMKEVF